MIPLVLGELEDRAAVVDADGVQQHVEAAEPLDDLGNDALPGPVLGEVGLDQLVARADGGELGAERFECALIAIDDGDGCPGPAYASAHAPPIPPAPATSTRAPSSPSQSPSC